MHDEKHLHDEKTHFLPSKSVCFCTFGRRGGRRESQMAQLFTIQIAFPRFRGNPFPCPRERVILGDFLWKSHPSLLSAVVNLISSMVVLRTPIWTKLFCGAKSIVRNSTPTFYYDAGQQCSVHLLGGSLAPTVTVVSGRAPIGLRGGRIAPTV